MIKISDPVIYKINDKTYVVSVTISYTDDATQVMLGVRNISINVGKDEDAIKLLKPFIEKATDELLKEHDDIVKFSAQFTGYKDSMNAIIATKIKN